MSSKVSVLVPTRGRVERLRTLLASYHRTTVDAYESAELLFRVDADDVETRAFLSETTHRQIVGPRLQGYRSLPVFFNELARAAQGDVLMCGNDDMVFQTVGWAPLILEEANNHPDGLFDIGVSTHNETHFPFATVSRRAVDALGFIWDPAIFWGDIFLRDVMAHFGRCVMLPTVRIDHDWVGWAPDQTYREANQNDIMRRDPTYWEGTHATAVRRAIAKLEALQ